MNNVKNVGQFGRDFTSGIVKGSLDFVLIPFRLPSVKNNGLVLTNIVYDLDARLGHYLGSAASAFTGGLGLISELGFVSYEAYNGSYWPLAAIAASNTASLVYESYKSSSRVYPNSDFSNIEEIVDEE